MGDNPIRCIRLRARTTILLPAQAAAATSAPETTAPQTGEIFRDVPQTASLLTPKPAIDPEVKPDTTAEVKPAGVVAEESGEVVDDEDAVVIADYESLYEGSEEAAVDRADMTGEKGSEGGEQKPSQEEEELDRSLSDVEKLLLDDNESTNSRDEEQEHGSRIQNEEARTESQAGEGVDAVVADTDAADVVAPSLLVVALVVVGVGVASC